MTTQIDLTNQVKNVLPHGEGGTDVSSPGASGNVLASDGTNWTSAAPPYDVIFSPNVVMGSGTEYRICVFTRTVIFPGNFLGSQGYAAVNPATTQTLTLNKNGSSCGTISISNAGAFTFTSTGGASVTFNAGDRVSVTNQSGADANMLIEFTLAGTR